MNYRDKIEYILKNNNFSQRFYVKYAVACAELAMTFSKEQDPRSLAGIAMAKRFANGEDVSMQEREDAYNDAASSSATYASAATALAAESAAAASVYAYAASAYYAYATCAVNAAYYASAANKIVEKQLYEILLALIDTEFTKLEQLLIGINI